MNPKVNELVGLLQTQLSDYEKASALVDAAEMAVLDRKQLVAQAHEALQQAETTIDQAVLADQTLKNDSARQNAMRTARAADLNWVKLHNEFRSHTHQLACEQQHVRQLAQKRTDLEIHGRNLRAAAELLAAQLHEQAQATRKVAAQGFLEGAARR